MGGSRPATCILDNWPAMILRSGISVPEGRSSVYVHACTHFELSCFHLMGSYRKDLKRFYVSDLGNDNIDVISPVQWYDHLHRQAIQVVEKGMRSEEHSMVAWQAFKETLNKVRLVGDKRMDDVSLNSEPVYDDEADEFEIEGDCGMTEYIRQGGVIQGENPIPPSVGMEFESYEDVYYFYNCYAKEQGFGVRVSNTWYRKSKERYRGKLSCSSAGFKKKSEANRPRPETRTGCPAMVKFRLMDNKRWRIIEVELEHNHLISPKSGKFYKSHKNLGAGTKRPQPLVGAEEAHKVRLFRTVIIDTEDIGNLYVDDGEFGNTIDQSNQLKLKQGDAQAIYNSFCHLQLMSPNFFYVMDLNEKGYMRNLFWADARCRAAYGYFGDVVSIDTTCLTDKFEVPLVVFTGVNHHGQPVILGCGLLASEHSRVIYMAV
ncbi:hypothetical protein HYC85_028471 [Camellia sinensis]|uniref:Protein FAR1-RELATED SEQUENCE n=1 Tax=Camellia sinensis TaxID=4442 RepID=A0A7J7FV91_CAMSI|nr:hypothetical protein HYC85_028471 [Camellia sinensis]